MHGECKARLVADDVAVHRGVKRLHVLVELVHQCLGVAGLQGRCAGVQAGVRRAAGGVGVLRECLLLLLPRALDVLARLEQVDAAPRRVPPRQRLHARMHMDMDRHVRQAYSRYAHVPVASRHDMTCMCVYMSGGASSGSGSGSESTGSSVSPSSSRSSSSPGSAKAGGGGGASEPVVTRATRLSAMARMVWLCSARATSSSRPSAALPPPSCSARPSSPCSAAAAVAASWSSSRLSSSGFRPRADSPAETRRSRSCETRSSASSAARSETAWRRCGLGGGGQGRGGGEDGFGGGGEGQGQTAVVEWRCGEAASSSGLRGDN